MTEGEVLADLFAAALRDTREQIAELDAAALAWQPDPGGNSIGVTVWHMARWLDVLLVQILEGRPAEAEQWHTQGWAARTGYDPRGIGTRGLGAVTGYTLAEVAALPPLSAADLLAYLDQVGTALVAHLRALPAAALAQPAPGGGSRPAYDRIKAILVGCLGHVGEIAALRALRARIG